jgi:hypothetical protein
MYLKSWRHWSTLAIDKIRTELIHQLPNEIDQDKFEHLWFNLGVAADNGTIQPSSFGDPGARSGYAVQFFCRARSLADLFMEIGALPDFVQESFHDILYNPLEQDMTTRLVSIGGGPGYDFVGVTLASTFYGAGTTATSIHGTVFDYEEGWYDLVKAMSTSTQLALHGVDNDYDETQKTRNTCDWGGKCDITVSLSHPSNVGCLKEVSTADLWVCQYCVAENYIKLRKSNYIFFVDIFKAAKDGALFVFTETTHRLWPEFVDVIIEHKEFEFEVAFSSVSMRGKSGPQMILRKKQGATIAEDMLELCDNYRQIFQLHDQKMKKGILRQPKKVRGSKQ